jgi:hypothetical protein
MSETKRQRYEKRLKALKTERSGWEAEWRSISSYVQPWRSRFCVSDTNKGTRHNDSMVDETPHLASRTLASGMMAGITSPARKWFKLEVPDPDLMESGAVKWWLYEVERRMTAAIGKANAYNSFHQLYTELGTFGTGAAFIVEDEETIFRVIPMTVGSYYLACSHRQVVDTLYRELRMTVRQLVDQFGRNKVSESVKNQYDNGNLDQWVDVVHLVEPNDERDPEKLDSKNKPFRSCYYEVGAKGSDLLSESGFDEFPVIAPRWDVLGEDVYGYGPGSVAVGASRALQVMQKRKAQAVEKMINPPMNVPSSSRNDPIDLRPGAVNYYDASTGMNTAAHPSQNINLPINYILEDITAHQDRINRAFFADLFAMMQNDTRSNITAREIQERHEEKLLQLGPVIERLGTEMLDPFIDRVFGIMMRSGQLPAPPEELQGLDLGVEYISVMAQAQKLVGTGAIERISSFVGNLAGADPSVLDKIDLDQTVDQYSQAVSAPPDIIRSDDDVEAIRQQRAQAEQAQQQMQMAQQAAQGAKLLSETDTQTENGLTQMMRQMGLA